MNLTSKEAEQYTNGKSTKEWQANGIAIDTRALQHGNLFVALNGNNTSGYNFIKEALKNGAVAAVVNKKEVKLEDTNYPLLIVEDTKKALIDLAKAARRNFKGKVLAVTGSVGKTTTKEMLKLALSEVTKVYANKGNYNNNIGMPLSLANLDNSYSVAIFELGMNKEGEIKTLTNILKPHLAIITEVSNTHSAFFNSLKDIFLAKMEVILGLISPRIFLFNFNNSFFKQAKNIVETKNIEMYSFGEEAKNNTENLTALTEAAHYTATKANFILLTSNIITKQSTNNIEFIQEITAKINKKIYKYTLPTLAEHKGILSVLVLGVVDLLGLNVEKAKNSLSNYYDIDGRGAITKVTLNKGTQLTRSSFFLIDDSYNASPLSMQKSILMLQNINVAARKILVLGDMLELKDQFLEHRKLKEYILAVKPSAVFTLGIAMQELIKVLPENMDKANYLNPKDLKQKLISYLQNNDIVLFKGSLGSNLHKVVKELKN